MQWSRNAKLVPITQNGIPSLFWLLKIIHPSLISIILFFNFRLIMHYIKILHKRLYTRQFYHICTMLKLTCNIFLYNRHNFIFWDLNSESFDVETLIHNRHKSIILLVFFCNLLLKRIKYLWLNFNTNNIWFGYFSLSVKSDWNFSTKLNRN